MSHASHIVNAFLRVYAGDRSNGIDRTEDDYVALWADHESLIREKYRELTAARARNDVGCTDRRFGHYEIVELLGRGGQGEVFLARDTVLGRKVALKVLHGSNDYSSSSRQRLLREGELASRLDHAALGTVYEAGDADGRFFLATAFIEGRTLAADIADESREGAATVPRTPSDLRRLLESFAHLARGLAAAHAQGILHRDIKPSNIMVRDDGSLVLIDFGLAKAVDGQEEAPTISAPGDLFGTTPYLAPELLAGERRANRRTDLFAFGATLHEAVCGQRAFRGPSLEMVIAAVLGSEPPRLTSLAPVANEDLDAIVEHLIAKDPDRRYGSAIELADDLDRAAAGEPVSVVRLGPLGRLRQSIIRRPKIAALLATTIAGLVVAAVFFGLWLGDRPAVRETERRLRSLRRDALLEKATYAMHVGGVRHALSYLDAAAAIDPSAIETRVMRAIVEIESADGTGPSTESRLDDPMLADLRPRLVALAAVSRGDVDAARSALDDTHRPTSAIGLYLDAVVSLRIAHRLRDSNLASDAAVLERTALDDLDVAVATSDTTRRLLHVERLHAADHVRDPLRTKAVARAADEVCMGSTIGRLCLSNALVDLGDLSRARSILDQVLRDVVAHDELSDVLRSSAYVNYFIVLRLEADHAAILEAADRYEREFPNRVEGRMERVMALAAAGRLDEADVIASGINFEGAPVVRPDHAAIYLDVAARLAFRRGDVPSAIGRLEEAVRRDPTNAASFHRLAFCLQGSDPSGSARAARQAVTLDPKRADSWALLGTVTTDEAEAIRSLRRSVALEGAPAHASSALALRLDRCGRFAEAKTHYARSIERGFEPARLDMVVMLLDIGELAAAAEYAKRGLEVRPDDPFVLASSAVVEAVNGNLDLGDDRYARARDVAAASGAIFPATIGAILDRARSLSLRTGADGSPESPSASRSQFVFDRIRARVDGLGGQVDRLADRELESATLELLQLAMIEGDESLRRSIAASALEYAEQRLETWREANADEAEDLVLLRSLRRHLAHAVVREFRDPARISKAAGKLELDWRRFFESVETLSVEVAARADRDERRE